MKRLFLSFLVLSSSFFTLSAQYSVLHRFNDTLGANPYSDLTLSGSTLYGMTNQGGALSFGIIFSLQSNGSNFTDLHDFNLTGGANPTGSLTLSGSTLYGMTSQGGANNYGVIFSVQTNGSGFTDLHDFTGTVVDGSTPIGSLILSGSTLYGMTYLGGSRNNGIIFSMQTNGSGFTVLHSFDSVAGSYPTGSLILSGSTLYGMTEFRGVNNYGVIFSMQTNGTGYTDIHDFNMTAGGNPYGSLILSGTTLYGMARQGGANSNGIIFSVQTNGSGFTDLHDFKGTAADGALPYGSLILSGTTLYGMTNEDGTGYQGNIFSMQTNGSGFTTLHNFKGLDGEEPFGSLILANKNLYGMTYYGGYDSCLKCSYGVIFKDSLAGSDEGVNELKTNSEEIRVYPNPGNGTFQLGISNGQLGMKYNVDVYNVLGEKIYSNTFSIQNSTFKIEGASGIYFYRVINDKGELIGEGKLIKE